MIELMRDNGKRLMLNQEIIRVEECSDGCVVWIDCGEGDMIGYQVADPYDRVIEKIKKESA